MVCIGIVAAPPDCDQFPPLECVKLFANPAFEVTKVLIPFPDGVGVTPEIVTSHLYPEPIFIISADGAGGYELAPAPPASVVEPPELL